MYEQYAKKVDEILAQEYGVGKGTMSYKTINKETMVLSLVMMDIIEKLEGIQKHISNNTQATEEKKSSKKKTGA